MLVDRSPRQEAEATLVTFCHHLQVAERVAANEILALNRCARGTTADRAPSLEHIVKCSDRGRPFEGVDGAPLATAAEPNAAGVAQLSDELGRVRFLAIARMEDF